MKLIKKIILFLKKKIPRYFLSLDSYYYCLSKNTTIYRFKIYGEHTFPKFTFDNIKSNNNLLYDINPMDLMKITINDYIASQRKTRFTVLEMLRDNKYKLSNNNVEEIVSGDEVYHNILLIEKIKNIDLYKIAYNTGLHHGRQIAKEISQNVSSEDLCNKNVVMLQVIDGKSYN